MIVTQGRVDAAIDPCTPQRPAASVVPPHGWNQPQSQPLLPWVRQPSPAQAELPWGIQLAPRPLPQLGVVDVVQAGLGVGLRAVEAVRKGGWPVGPVLCCISHARIHIPVESDTAYRWHAPQTVCRAGVWECTTDGPGMTYSRCSGVWLFPPDAGYACTDAPALLHWLSLTRSAGVRSVGERRGS